MGSAELDMYSKVRRARSPSFGPNGEEIVFLMNTTGTSEIWKLNKPMEWPQQLTFESERVRFASWSPSCDELVFGKDKDGNEYTQLYRLKMDAGVITPLTTNSDAIYEWGAWSPDGNQIAYSSNKRDPSVFDLYIQSPTRSEDDAELAYRSDGALSVTEWSPDGDALAVVRRNASFDTDVFSFELSSREMRLVSDPDIDAKYDDICWGPSGDFLYGITDYQSNNLYLARFDIESNKVVPIYKHEAWNVEKFAFHPQTGHTALGVNVNGYTNIIIGKLEGTNIQQLWQPSLPKGVYSDFEFNTNGNKLALTASGNIENPNVFVVDLSTREHQRWTNAPTGGLPKESFIESELIRYPTFDGKTIPSFFSLPDGVDSPVPVIVDIHGGPESQRRPRFHSRKQFFLAHGYAVFEPNIRGSTGYGKTYRSLDDVRRRVDAIQDVVYAAKWLSRHRMINERKIVAFGGSYGGFVALAAIAKSSEWWAGGISVMGITNLVTFLEETGEWRRENREAEYGKLESDREFLKSISPLYNIEQIDSPLLLMHGANDPRVPVDETKKFISKAKRKNLQVEKLIFENEGHVLSREESVAKLYRKTLSFLEEYM